MAPTVPWERAVGVGFGDLFASTHPTTGVATAAVTTKIPAITAPFTASLHCLDCFVGFLFCLSIMTSSLLLAVPSRPAANDGDSDTIRQQTQKYSLGG